MSASVWAGGDAPIVPADPDNEHLVKISLLEGAELHRAGVRFYDVNALELWADGFIPGAVYFNYSDWKKLLPEDKSTPMVFYCANRLCENSEAAARQVIRLGYTHAKCPKAFTVGVKTAIRRNARNQSIPINQNNERNNLYADP